MLKRMDLTQIVVRSYRPEDRAACLAIFDSNVPTSFTAPERSEFESYLDALPGPYLVLERDDRVVACGGFALAQHTSCADLCWGMVDRQDQGIGLGRLLTEARLQRIYQDATFTEVALRTSHLTEAFYVRMGFVTERVTPNGIAPGVHKCEMRLKVRTLRLVSYDAAWPARFEAEAARVRAALGDAVSAIEHIGSTAVPGLAGKPVIDFGIAVLSEAAADSCIAPLESLGYEYRGTHGDDPRRRYYVRNVDGVRTEQIHLYVLPAPAWEEHLAFRDMLRADPALVSAYAAKKYRVAEAVGWDKAAYSIAKGDFVQRVLSTRTGLGKTE
jgi:GrpB-like predicted nucleotidyltransferase (UPF0157 family)